MSKKLFRTLFLTTTSLSSVFVAAQCSTNNPEPKKPEPEVTPAKPTDDNSTNNDSSQAVSNINFERFNSEIIESATNEYPSVFVSRNASQFFISSFIQLVAQLQLINKQETKRPYNDVIYLIDTDVNSYAKTLNKEPQRFNFESLLAKYQDVALRNYNAEYNSENGQLLLSDHTKYLNNFNFVGYSIFPRKLDELKAYLKPYLDKGVSLFDFYIPDISFTAMDKNTRDFILKHANKIVILSDGNAQPYRFINDNYIKWVKGQTTHYTKEELLKAWDSLKTDNPTEIDYHYFYTLDEKFRIYNLSGDYDAFFNKDLEENGFSWAKLNIYDYPLNYTQVAKNIPQLNEKEFLTDYNKLINLENKKLEDLIVYGKENLDKSKKNLVFIGSSLFRKFADGTWRIKTDTQSRNELHAYFDKIMKLYPPSEYNYLYKLHPVYKGTDALEYIKEFTNNHESNAIILDPSVSWENMLALDMQELQSNNSLLFDKDDFKNNTSKTKLFGIQPTSTVLLSTLVMLQAQFNISLEQAKLFVDPKNFPLSDNFNIIKRDFHYKGTQGQTANRKELYEVYKHFIDTGLFPALDEFPAMSEFLKTNN
ncbi:hypothetical protein [Mycoplasmopsis columboralis]|uniref:Lipoprotein n=1 Tax=Mycoplasmopsis columboralis TaxID=171282 RepID=A0A449B5W0_9BACT|nr:hypothetical protein [Mycoplasmopsis columboralis]VEU75908.1 Uncharacterised protein [Mycoplasmopsis columboralis]